MAVSEARSNAARINGSRSKGPVTEAGKSISRANSLKHGLTGAGVVLPEGDAAEVERKAAVYAREMNASGELAMDIARRAALASVRMDRCANQQSAALCQHVRQVEAEFEAPEGVDELEAAKLRHEAVRAAMFDPSKEAALARKYEASAVREFFRCLKELKQLDKAPNVAQPRENFKQTQALLGSFSKTPKAEAVAPKPAAPPLPTPARSFDFEPNRPENFVPISAARPR